MNAIEGIMKFQVDRNLHMKPFHWATEATNIIEELYEAVGINDRSIAELTVGDMMLNVKDAILGKNTTSVTIDDEVDAFADVIVFAIGAITKLGYDPEKVLKEVSKEINSREGEMINGKFVKFTTQEAKAKWYKANFDRCKFNPPEMQNLRSQFLDKEGYMATDQEIKQWALDQKLNG